MSFAKILRHVVRKHNDYPGNVPDLDLQLTSIFNMLTVKK